MGINPLVRGVWVVDVDKGIDARTREKGRRSSDRTGVIQSAVAGAQRRSKTAVQVSRVAGREDCFEALHCANIGEDNVARPNDRWLISSGGGGTKYHTDLHNHRISPRTSSSMARGLWGFCR